MLSVLFAVDLRDVTCLLFWYWARGYLIYTESTCIVDKHSTQIIIVSLDSLQELFLQTFDLVELICINLTREVVR